MFVVCDAVTDASAARAVDELEGARARRPDRRTRHVRARRRAGATTPARRRVRPPRLPDVFVRLARGARRRSRGIVASCCSTSSASASRPSRTCATASGATPIRREQVARARGLESVVLVTHDMGDTVGGELLARDLDGELDFGDRSARADERQHLHRDGAPHAGPAVPARRSTTRGSSCRGSGRRSGRELQGRPRVDVRERASRVGTKRWPRSGSSSRTTRATR